MARSVRGGCGTCQGRLVALPRLAGRCRGLGRTRFPVAARLATHSIRARLGGRSWFTMGAWRDSADGGRRYTNYVHKYGHAPEQGTLEEQLDYTMHELKGSERGAWRNILQRSDNSPGERAAAISTYFERLQDTAAEESRRSGIASRLATLFASGWPGAPFSPPAGGAWLRTRRPPRKRRLRAPSGPPQLPGPSGWTCICATRRAGRRRQSPPPARRWSRRPTSRPACRRHIEADHAPSDCSCLYAARIFAAAFLNRRAGDSSKRAKHAAVARLRPQQRSAAGAFVEEQASIGRHRLDFRRAARWAGDGGRGDDLNRHAKV